MPVLTYYAKIYCTIVLRAYEPLIVPKCHIMPRSGVLWLCYLHVWGALALQGKLT